MEWNKILISLEYLESYKDLEWLVFLNSDNLLNYKSQKSFK
jgi:hypothetical protein